MASGVHAKDILPTNAETITKFSNGENYTLVIATLGSNAYALASDIGNVTLLSEEFSINEALIEHTWSFPSKFSGFAAYLSDAMVEQLSIHPFIHALEADSLDYNDVEEGMGGSFQVHH